VKNCELDARDEHEAAASAMRDSLMFVRSLTSALLTLALTAGAARAQASLVFRNVAVVDLDGGAVRPDVIVEVVNGRITRVEPAGGQPSPASPQSTVVDGRGKFLIPGLWDSHVHLTKLGAAGLSAFVANGVTSVRDMGSDLAEVLQWRREIESGARPGPRIKTAGQILETRANVERMKREMTVEPVDRLRIPVGTPGEAKAAVARLAKAGADLLKVRSVADLATLWMLADAARAHGLKLTGHPVAPPATLIDVRMASVEHQLTSSPLTSPHADRRALFERMRDANVWIGTTTVNIEGSILVSYETAVARLSADPLRRFVSRYLAADWLEQVQEKKLPEAAAATAAYKKELPNLVRDLREMHAAGVKLLAGSDAGVVFMYAGFSLHGELESLVEGVGLTPVEVLRVATVNPAAFFGLERELGAIRPGYRADLVLLNGNPLEDIRRTREIAGVVRNGKWFDRAALDALLERSAVEARR
jgi:imidazolonepropionase-like amidohydrolase